ncbi:MAG TPA: tetratricopeptide repeat protein [Terriglobia bacterium]|nr:tetratricopeptide repeat protein [Terriglobia bacterium]
MKHRSRMVLALGCIFFLVLCGVAAAQSNTLREMQLHYERAQEALKANQPEMAEREFREMLRLDPHNASVYANLGALAYARGDYEQAAKAFHNAVTWQPSLWKAQAFLGMSELRLGRAREAETHLEKSFPHLQQPKLQSQVGSDLIALYSQTGEEDKAVDLLRTLERLNPSDPEVLYDAYRTYSDLAAHALAQLIKVAPDSGRMHEILAQTLMNQNDYPGAIEQYRKALQADPRLPGIHFELGQAILASSTDEKAREQAQKEFEAALAANPADADSEYELGEIAWLRSDLHSALEDYSRALAIRPDFAEAQIGLGKVLTAMGQPQKALEHLLDAARLDPQNEMAHYHLAMTYRKLGRAAEAEREWNTFQRLRNSQLPVRRLYQQIQQRPAPAQGAAGAASP